MLSWLFILAFVTVKGNLAYDGIAYQEEELKVNVCLQYEKKNHNKAS